MAAEVRRQQVNLPLDDYLLYTAPKEKQHSSTMTAESPSTLRWISLGLNKTWSSSLRSVPTALLCPIHIHMSKITSHIKRNLSVVLYQPKGASLLSSHN